MIIGCQVHQRWVIIKSFVISQMKDLKKYSTKDQETLQDIRLAQREHGFIIPSDYVYFLMNCNGFEFDEPPIIKLGIDEYEFGEFYDLQTLVWELAHYRKMVENYNHYFWLKDYLSVGNIDDHRIVIGTKPENINEVHLYNDEEGTTVKIADNIFVLLEMYI